MQKKDTAFQKIFVIKSNWVSWRSSTRNLYLDFVPTVLYSFRNDIALIKLKSKSYVSTKKYCLFAKRASTETRQHLFM